MIFLNHREDNGGLAEQTGGDGLLSRYLFADDSPTSSPMAGLTPITKETDDRLPETERLPEDKTTTPESMVEPTGPVSTASATKSPGADNTMSISPAHQAKPSSSVGKQQCKNPRTNSASKPRRSSFLSPSPLASTGGPLWIRTPTGASRLFMDFEDEEDDDLIAKIRANRLANQVMTVQPYFGYGR